MPVRRRLFFLTAPLLLLATHARAQGRPAPPPEPAPQASQQVLTLRVTLPTAVGYAMRLFSKDDKAQKPASQKADRTTNPVLVFTVPVPQLLGGGKTDAAPTPKKD